MSFNDSLKEIARTGRKVLVVGLGVSGVESARFLSRSGHGVIVTERQSEAEFRRKSKFVEGVDRLIAAGVSVRFGVDGEQVAPFLDGVGLVVLSPGVPLESAVVGTINRFRIPYVSELELGIELHGGRSVVVTGSNGKSTTVSLLDFVLRRGGISSRLCGNVGIPVISSDEIGSDDETKRSVLVVEASSYQLEACTVLKPIISVVLNISENHLERHGTIERYAAAKGRVFARQTGDDYMIANADDPIVMSLARAGRANLAVFGERSEQELAGLASDWAHIGDRDLIVLSLHGAREEYSMVESPLLGRHNRYNAAAVILAARRMGIESESIQRSLLTFSPLEHRLEPVPNKRDFLVFNDSKSTTVAASVAALETVRNRYPNRPLVLLIGGLSKAGSWNPLLVNLKANTEGIRPVVCFGKDGPLLASHCKAAGIPCRVVKNLREAAECGIEELGREQNAILLLTPGCASFDEFSDFEHRGHEFKSYVTALTAQ